MLKLLLDNIIVIALVAVVMAMVLVSLARRARREEGPRPSSPRPIMQTLGVVVLGAVALLAVLGRLGWFDPASPLPPEALDQLKGLVEADGRQARPVDVFSMPGSISPVSAAVDTVKVTRIKYLYLIPTHEAHGAIPAGTTVGLYRVEDTRVSPGGARRSEARLFYVYQDAAGTWRFLEQQKIDGSSS